MQNIPRCQLSKATKNPQRLQNKTVNIYDVVLNELTLFLVKCDTAKANTS